MINFIIFLLTLTLTHNLIIYKVKSHNLNRKIKFKSTATYYGMYATSWNLFIAIFFSLIMYYFALDKFILLAIIPPIIFSFYYLFNLKPRFKSREKFESIILNLFALCASFTIFITIMIIFSVLLQANKFFDEIPAFNFLFGLNWNPQNEISSEIKNSYGIIPVLGGTFLITCIAILIAAPIGVLSATYLSEYASDNMRKRIKPLIEVLAGIPSIVYGYFATVTVSPFIKHLGISVGIDVSSESAICVGIVMGIMIMPYILSLTDDVIHSVPQTLRDASYALGATKAETITNVVLPAAKSGIYSAILLAISRAIGETMIVAMAAGLSANLTFNPLESVTTSTVQIVALLTGDQEFNSIKTNAAFALALVLFILTFIINILSQIVMEKGKVKYE